MLRGLGCPLATRRGGPLDPGLVVAEVPDQGQHHRRPEADARGRAEHDERDQAGYGDDGHPRLSGPGAGLSLGEVVHRRGGSPVGRDEQPRRHVQHHAHATTEGEQRPADTNQDRVDVPVAGDATADAGQLLVGGAAPDRPDRTHGTILSAPGPQTIRDDPHSSRSSPDRGNRTTLADVVVATRRRAISGGRSTSSVDRSAEVRTWVQRIGVVAAADRRMGVGSGEPLLVWEPEECEAGGHHVHHRLRIAASARRLGRARHRCGTRGTPDRHPRSPICPGADEKPPRPAGHQGGRGSHPRRRLHRPGPASGLARAGHPDRFRRAAAGPVPRRDRVRSPVAAAAPGTGGERARPRGGQSQRDADRGEAAATDRLGQPARPRRLGDRVAVAGADQSVGGQRPPVLAGGLRLRRCRVGVAAGRLEPAAEVARRGWWARLVGAVRGPRWLALGAPGGRRTRPRRCRVRHGGRAAEPDPGAARGDGHDRAGAGRSGGRPRALALPLPDRTHARRGPRRCGPMPAPTWPPTCTTRCCRRWP